MVFNIIKNNALRIFDDNTKVFLYGNCVDNSKKTEIWIKRIMDLKAKINKITVIIAKKANELFGDSLEKVIFFCSYARGDYDKETLDVSIFPNAVHRYFLRN